MNIPIYVLLCEKIAKREEQNIEVTWGKKATTLIGRSDINHQSYTKHGRGISQTIL
jgi:hypothetical protein